MWLISLSNWHPMWLISLSNWHPMWLISLSNWHPMWLISLSNWHPMWLISLSNRISSVLSVTRKFLPNFLWQTDKETFQNERFVRYWSFESSLYNSLLESFILIMFWPTKGPPLWRRQENLPKWAFHTRHSQKRTKKSSKMSVSYETFAKKDKEIFQNERFVRDIRKKRQRNLPKWAFRTRHSQKLTKRPCKMSVSYETFAKKDKEIFQNERFVRDIRKNWQRDLPKWAFRARHSQKRTKKSSKMSVSYETFAKKDKEIFQNERFVRDIRKKRQRNLPKWAFRTRHSQKLTKRPCKMSVSYETFAKTDKETFQNERFVRDIRKNWQRDLPKWAFRARHSQKRTKKSSKMSVSYETFAKKDKEIFQNERFVRDIRKKRQRNLPKWAFRTRHSQKRTPQSSKRSVSCETFAKTDKETLQNERFVRDIRKNWQRDLPKWAFRTRHSQKRAPKSSKRSVSCETFAKTDKETFQNERFLRDIRKNGHRNLPKGAFRARHSQKQTPKSSKRSVSCETFAKTAKETFQNERFVRDIRKNGHRNLPKGAFRARHSQKQTPKSSKRSVSCETFAKTKISALQCPNGTACISHIRHARSPQRVAHANRVTQFRLGFAHPTRTISAEGCARTPTIAVSPRFRASDTHNLRRGLRTPQHKCSFA